MDHELRREGIKSVDVTEDPATGKMDLTIDIDPQKVDHDTLLYLQGLSGKSAIIALERMGMKSVQNIKLKIDEEVIGDLDEKSKRLQRMMREKPSKSKQ